MKAWFRWERNPRGWGPVIVFDEARPKIPKGSEDMITPAVEAPSEYVDGDGSAMFGRLAKMFPAPKEEV